MSEYERETDENGWRNGYSGSRKEKRFSTDTMKATMELVPDLYERVQSVAMKQDDQRAAEWLDLAGETIYDHPSVLGVMRMKDVMLIVYDREDISPTVGWLMQEMGFHQTDVGIYSTDPRPIICEEFENPFTDEDFTPGGNGTASLYVLEGPSTEDYLRGDY